LGVQLTFLLLPFALEGLGEARGGKVRIPFALDFKFLQGPGVMVLLIVSQVVHCLGQSGWVVIGATKIFVVQVFLECTKSMIVSISHKDRG
jgi:hypothetical protein